MCATILSTALKKMQTLVQKRHVFRVKPKQELVSNIARYCRQHGITSGLVLGIIGSPEKARITFLTELPGNYENVEKLRQ